MKTHLDRFGFQLKVLVFTFIMKKRLTSFDKKKGIVSGAIEYIFEDVEGRLWLGSWMGLFRYDEKSFVNVTKNGPWGK